MIDLITLLPTIEGTDHIQRCWGDVPPFRWDQLLHVKQSGSWAEQRLLATTIFLTDGPENINECKPSRIVVEFEGVLYWEHAQESGIRLGELLASPPPGTIAVHMQNEFYVVCRNVRVLSCVRESFSEAD